MLTVLISLLSAAATAYACIHFAVGKGGTIGYSITAFFLTMILQGFLVRKRITKVQEELQAIMTKGQNRINRKVQHFQSKPGGNPVQMQRELEGEQKVMIKQALDFTAKLEPFKKWNMVMGRQIATMRLQFLYQLKEFKQVDEILAKRSMFSGPLMSDPSLVAVKMCREYENKNIEAAAKTFKRHVKWFRGDRASLLYGLMSWIHMKQGEPDLARKVLLKGKEVTGNEVLTRNWEHLSNDNAKKFSNAGLGDEWYALYLEKPTPPKQKRVRGNARGANMF
ncbi:hypothetical protein P3T73_15690 [Kiritimatiellota bacterium B12222]|nr:hypothetical protein P3T73_15690 [Kiritimatiellota bacterium B12222]